MIRALPFSVALIEDSLGLSTLISLSPIDKICFMSGLSQISSTDDGKSKIIIFFLTKAHF